VFRPCLRFSCGPSHSAEEEESLDKQKKGRRQTMLSPCSLAWLQFISWSFFDSKPLKLENGDRDREARRTRAMKPPRSDRRCGHVEAYRGIGRRPAGRQWGMSAHRRQRKLPRCCASDSDVRSASDGGRRAPPVRST